MPKFFGARVAPPRSYDAPPTVCGQQAGGRKTLELGAVRSQDGQRARPQLVRQQPPQVLPACPARQIVLSSKTIAQGSGPRQGQQQPLLSPNSGRTDSSLVPSRIRGKKLADLCAKKQLHSVWLWRLDDSTYSTPQQLLLCFHAQTPKYCPNSSGWGVLVGAGFVSQPALLGDLVVPFSPLFWWRVPLLKSTKKKS